PQASGEAVSFDDYQRFASALKHRGEEFLTPRSRATQKPRRLAGLMAGGIPPAARLVQEPDAPLGLVDPYFEQARSRHVVLLVAEIVRFAHDPDQRLVVAPELGQHIERIDVIGVVVG